MRTVLALIVITLFCSCSSANKYYALQHKLNRFVEGKDATVGIAVIIDGKDTVSVNGNRRFPMLSVYKLPIALAFGDYWRFNSQLQSDSIMLFAGDLKPDTYSPMRDKYAGIDSVRIPLREVMAYALQQSDNNASDILLKMMNGTANVAHSLQRLGAKDINVVSTEYEMHDDHDLCYKNNATPLAMAELIDKFCREFDDPFSQEIQQLMETCETGIGRLPKPLQQTNAVIGHKTGTGFILQGGRLMAVNDVGYVKLPNGQCYTIAVFIENSGYDIAATEAIISGISEMVYTYIISDL